MRAMKDSGVEWIGEIPVDWGMRRLRYLCSIATGNQDTQDNDPDGEYPFYVRSPIVERSKRYTFEGPAILMSGDGVGAGRIFHRVSGKYACHQRVYSLQQIHNVDSVFLFYYLRELFPITLEMANAKSTVDSVRLPMLQDFSVLLPPPAEQQRIAAYLDEQCGEIDKVLAKTRESIEEYKKLKQSVITEAVTKGIRPNRPMKPSGIEWIGDIPEEWEVVKLKRLAKIETGNTPPKNSESIFFSRESGYLWIKAENLGSTKSIEETTEYLTEEGIKHGRLFPAHSVFVCCIASVGKVGFCSKAASCNQQINALSFTNAHWKYGFYLTVAQETEYLLYASGNVMKIINSEKQSNLMCPLPQLAEQAEIVAYLDQQCAEIDRLIAKKEQIITELESYKKSLIYECVTGKREVAG